MTKKAGNPIIPLVLNVPFPNGVSELVNATDAQNSIGSIIEDYLKKLLPPNKMEELLAGGKGGDIIEELICSIWNEQEGIYDKWKSIRDGGNMVDLPNKQTAQCGVDNKYLRKKDLCIKKTTGEKDGEFLFDLLVLDNIRNRYDINAKLSSEKSNYNTVIAQPLVTEKDISKRLYLPYHNKQTLSEKTSKTVGVFCNGELERRILQNDGVRTTSEKYSQNLYRPNFISNPGRDYPKLLYSPGLINFIKYRETKSCPEYSTERVHYDIMGHGLDIDAAIKATEKIKRRVSANILESRKAIKLTLTKCNALWLVVSNRMGGTNPVDSIREFLDLSKTKYIWILELCFSKKLAGTGSSATPRTQRPPLGQMIFSRIPNEKAESDTAQVIVLRKKKPTQKFKYGYTTPGANAWYSHVEGLVKSHLKRRAAAVGAGQKKHLLSVTKKAAATTAAKKVAADAVKKAKTTSVEKVEVASLLTPHESTDGSTKFPNLYKEVTTLGFWNGARRHAIGSDTLDAEGKDTYEPEKANKGMLVWVKRANRWIRGLDLDEHRVGSLIKGVNRRMDRFTSWNKAARGAVELSASQTNDMVEEEEYHKYLGQALDEGAVGYVVAAVTIGVNRTKAAAAAQVASAGGAAAAGSDYTLPHCDYCSTTHLEEATILECELGWRCGSCDKFHTPGFCPDYPLGLERVEPFGVEGEGNILTCETMFQVPVPNKYLGGTNVVNSHRGIQTPDDEWIAVEVGGGGDCLFYSLAYLIYGKSALHEQVRREIVECLTHEDDDVFRGRRGGLVRKTDYLNSMGQVGTWGTDLEIRVAARIYNRTINVYVETRKETEEFRAAVAGAGTGPTIYLILSGGVEAGKVGIGSHYRPLMLLADDGSLSDEEREEMVGKYISR